VKNATVHKLHVWKFGVKCLDLYNRHAVYFFGLDIEKTKK